MALPFGRMLWTFRRDLAVMQGRFRERGTSVSSSDILLAIDLGAESGRAVSGRFNGKRLELTEIHRFINQPVTVGSTLYWDILGLFANVEQAIEKARASGSLRSVGIDTW